MIRVPWDHESDDGGEDLRERLEARAAARIVEAQVLADALDVVEAAVPQLGPGSLPAVAERLLRAGSRAMARLRGTERQAVRERVREAAESDPDSPSPSRSCR